MKLYYKFLVFIPVVILFSGCNGKKKYDASWSMPKIPVENEVGAALLPAEIAPVVAPFSTIKFEKPSFPAGSLTLSLSKSEMNTARIQKGIDELSAKGGGTVVVPSGEWKTGRIILKDNINLYLDEGAVLRFSAEVKDFLPVVFTRIEGVEVMSLGACIYANGATNIAVTGKGRLVGPGKGSVRERILTTDVIDNVIDPATPVEERIVDGIKQPWIFPPMFISPINCNKIYIEGVLLDSTAFWNIVPVYCDNVIIRGVTVSSVGIPRGDGIDIESSKNVLIEYCTLSCGDDCFTMKAGRGDDGIRVNKPTENVVVRYCLAKKGHGGITCGSETAGVIRNLYVHDCVFSDSGVGLRFKTRRPRGGGGENLVFERIRLNLNKSAFEWDMLGSSMHVGDMASRLPARPVNKLTPHYGNIHVKDILVENASCLVKVIGIPESPVYDVTIENVVANCSKLFLAQDLRNSIFRNISVSAQDSVLKLTDSRNIHFENIEFKTNTAPVKLVVDGDQSDSITVTSCLNMDDVK